MKPQFKLEEIYLDLSKLSEEQQINIFKVLNENNQLLTAQLHDIFYFRKYSEFNFYSLLFLNQWKIWQVTHKIHNLKELTYSQFLDMMGESKEKSKVIENSEKERINSDGTLYIGEGLENYYKEQLERTGKFKVVSIDATSEEVLQVENNGWIKIESESIIPNGDSWMIENEENEIMAVFDVDEDTNQDSIRKYYSHYQPIIKPEPPKS